MIQELHIHNLAVIEDATLEFSSRDTALVGETGAGKSLVVNSLMLLMGNRSDFSLVRDSQKKAYVSALFQIEEGFLQNHAELKDYVNEDKTLLIKRVLNSDKTSRYYLNDEQVTANELREVTSHLIDIHSQNAKSDLLDETKQIRYLDMSSEEILSALQDYRKAYYEYTETKNQLSQLVSSHKEYDREYLEFQIKEIEKYHLSENEIEELNAEYLSLRDQDRLKEKYMSFKTTISSSSLSLNEMLSQASHQLKGLFDTSLDEKAKRVYSEILSLQEFLNDLDYEFESKSIDPKRIDDINERLFSLKGLMRKYGKTTKEILTKYDSFRKTLSQMDSYEENVKDLETEIERKKASAMKKAEILSSLRENQALVLSKNIQDEMESLGLRKGGFRIDVEKKDELSENGIDHVTFKVSLNAGLSEQPLSKAASGGEASRLMLALKIVLNRIDPYDLMVLDEIDTGISGKASFLVAKKIRQLSRESSLIIISHIPQVVSSCDTSIQIEKKTDGKNTFTTAKSLDEKETIRFVAAMISLDKVTDNALSQAQELYSEFHK